MPLLLGNAYLQHCVVCDTLPRTHFLALGRGCLSRGHERQTDNDRTVPRDGSGEPARAWSPAWGTVVRGSLQWPPARVMCVPSPMAYPAVRPLPKLPLLLRPETRTGYLCDTDYLFGQNMTEYNHAPSPSGAPVTRFIAALRRRVMVSYTTRHFHVYYAIPR